jgi:hypothetical protein
MSKHNFRILIGFSLIALAVLACALPGGSASPNQPEGASPVPGETQSAAAQPAEASPVPATATLAPTATPTPTPPPSQPVGLRQGLASLNSYQVKYSQFLDGPGAQDKNHTTTEYFYSSEGDRSHTHAIVLNSTADNPSSESRTTDRYQIGPQICSLPASEEGKSPLTTSNPMAEEMGNVLTGQMDLTLYTENPVLIGEEEINGVQTYHFQFKVSGLGKKSGAEVTQASGDYWSAVDGNFLVKYHLILEMRSAPEGSDAAQVIHSETSYDLSSINQAVTIEMPAECK